MTFVKSKKGGNIEAPWDSLISVLGGGFFQGNLTDTAQERGKAVGEGFTASTPAFCKPTYRVERQNEEETGRSRGGSW